MEAINLEAVVASEVIEEDLPYDPPPCDDEDETDWHESQYHIWKTELDAQEARELERQQWEKAMPHKSIIFMDKMHECPHKKTDPILDSVIYPGSLTILAADPKCGKSTFLFHALQAISDGKPFCGLNTRRVTTLYASEQPFQSLNSQVSRIPNHERNSHVGFVPYEFNYLEREHRNEETGKIEMAKIFPQNWEQQIGFWRERIRAIKAGLLIVDTFTAFAMFKGGEAYDSGPVTTRLQQLKSLQADSPDLAIVVCHHLRKEDNKRAYGARAFNDIANSYALRAASDMNILMWQPSGKAEDKNLRTMRIEGRFLEEEVSFHFRKVGEIFNPSDAPAKRNSHDRILEAIYAKPSLNALSVRDLANELGKSKSVIGRFREEYPQDHMAFAGFDN
jgi:hypothetical protein